MASTDDTQVSRSVLSLPSGNSNLADEMPFIEYRPVLATR